MSLLLGKKDILLINTKLAVIIGLNDAVVLQQLSYWLEETTSGIEHDGMRWIYNTHEQWQEQFPFWSIDTVKRSFASLHKRELIFVKQLAAAMRNQTNYYAINQPAVDALHQGILPSSRSARCPDPKGQIAPIQKGKMPRSSSKTETTTETTTEILPAAPTALPAVIEIGLPAKQKKPRAKAEPDAETEAAKANRQAAWSAFDDASAPLRNDDDAQRDDQQPDGLTGSPLGTRSAGRCRFLCRHQRRLPGSHAARPRRAPAERRRLPHPVGHRPHDDRHPCHPDRQNPIEFRRSRGRQSHPARPLERKKC